MENLFGNMGMGSGILVVLLLILVIILLINVVNSNMRIRRLERKYKMFMKGKDAQSLEKTFVREFTLVDKLAERSDSHTQDIRLIKKKFERIFTKYGVEKYDAFDDVGGKMSFTLALLDSNNTGIILNAVHSRDNCFLYLKEIVKGESYAMLSQEEVEALRRAVNFGMEDEISPKEMTRNPQRKARMKTNAQNHKRNEG